MKTLELIENRKFQYSERSRWSNTAPPKEMITRIYSLENGVTISVALGRDSYSVRVDGVIIDYKERESSGLTDTALGEAFSKSRSEVL